MGHKAQVGMLGTYSMDIEHDSTANGVFVDARIKCAWRSNLGGILDGQYGKMGYGGSLPWRF